MKRKKVLTTFQLYYTLKSIQENDCYLEEFLEEEILENFLTVLVDYNIVFVASDDRILLTPAGEEMFQNLIFSVEFSHNNSNLYSK